MHKSDRSYLSKFELGPDPYNGDDELEFISFDDDSYPDEFSEKDESFWVENIWDEYM